MPANALFYWDCGLFQKKKGGTFQKCHSQGERGLPNVPAVYRHLIDSLHTPPVVHTLDVLDFRLASKNRLKILPLKALRKQAQK